MKQFEIHCEQSQCSPKDINKSAWVLQKNMLRGQQRTEKRLCGQMGPKLIVLDQMVMVLAKVRKNFASEGCQTDLKVWRWISDGMELHVGIVHRIVGTMTAHSYVNILSTNLPTIAEKLGLQKEDIVFQQDNNPKHTAKLTKKMDQ